MLQRAASNAYSWWWASHIRTTQSKWLDANLQDMENRVKVMLKLLEEEADTFGKRAEMYYRRRPQVITHVEEVYRAYRALVERYDHLSKELHKANHTIATACPEEVQYAMLEEEDANFPRAILPINSRKIQKSTVEEILKRKREGPLELKKGGREKSAPHMSKDKAEEEIGRLQKAILILQTEKEFVKSSYESGIAKYWEIEKQIADMQEEICHMQDDFDTDAAIDDDEARALMTITALKSCQGMVADLVEKFEELIRTANIESEKIKSLREKLYAMKRSIGSSTGEVSTTNMTENGRVYPITREILELQNIYEEIENFFKKNSESSVEEMSQKVDELVDKVINLELEFPKQSAQIKKLKEENKSVENKLYDLQDEIALRDDPSDLSEELRLVESELDGMEVLARSIVEEELVVSNFFSEVFSCITDISKAFGGTTPEHLTGLSTATGEGATPSEDTCIDNSTKENTSMKEQEMREMETPSRGDHDSTGGTHGIHYSKDGEEENFYDLMEEEFKDEKSLQAGNHVDPIVGSDNENSLNKTCEGKAEGSSEQIDQSSSACTNQNCDTSKDPSVEVDESSFGGGNKSQNWRIDSDESILGYFLIQDEGLGVGDGKTPKTQGNDADKILDCHIGEAKLVEVLPKLDSQLPENVEGFKECRQIDSSEDTSSGHNVQDLKSRVLVDAYSSEGREGTSPYVPARDSEKTGEMYQLASEVPINSEKSSLIAQEDEPSWHEFPLDGHEGKNAILLADYTSVLRNYKETKRRLAELEKKNQEHLEETKAVIRELRTANSIKYVEIQSLRNLLESSETSTGKMGTDRSRTTLDREISVVEETILSDAVAEKIASPFEVKFRTEMDAMVEENLRFLARYSMACHRMQEFDRRYQDLQNEMENSEGKIGGESEPAQKFRELRTELEVWFEQKELLNQELQLKTASLGRLQEEIAEALRTSTEVPDGARFTPYEAAKFQGEVLNMQQSNNKIESELQTALESMKELEGKVIVDIRKLRESSELSSRRSSQSERESNYHSQYTPFPSLPRVPLRKFLFGPKKPKKRSSIFGCMNPSYQRQFSDL